MMEWIFPGWTASDTESTALMPPKAIEMSRISTRGVRDF